MTRGATCDEKNVDEKEGVSDSDHSEMNKGNDLGHNDFDHDVADEMNDEVAAIEAAILHDHDVFFVRDYLDLGKTF